MVMMQVSTMSLSVIRHTFHGFFVGLTIIPSQSMGDECFGVNPNAAKTRGSHEGEKQDDDEDGAPSIWSGRRRGRVFEIGVHEIHHVGRRRMRAEGEVVEVDKVYDMNAALLINLGRGERRTGGLQQPGESRGRGEKGDFERWPVIVRRGSSSYGFSRKVPLVRHSTRMRDP